MDPAEQSAELQTLRDAAQTLSLTSGAMSLAQAVGLVVVLITATIFVRKVSRPAFLSFVIFSVGGLLLLGANFTMHFGVSTWLAQSTGDEFGLYSIRMNTVWSVIDGISRLCLLTALIIGIAKLARVAKGAKEAAGTSGLADESV